MECAHQDLSFLFELFFKICPFLTRLQMCPWKTFSETSRHRCYSKAGSNKYWCFTRVWRLKIQGEIFQPCFKTLAQEYHFCWVPTAPSNFSPVDISVVCERNMLWRACIHTYIHTYIHPCIHAYTDRQVNIERSMSCSELHCSSHRFLKPAVPCLQTCHGWLRRKFFWTIES